MVPLGRPAGADGQATRRRIIAAAIQCVASVGYSRSTIREIARAANVTSANLYNYFPTKVELIQAAIEARAQQAVPRLRDAAMRPGSAVDRISALLDESEKLLQDYPDLAAFEWAIRSRAEAGVDPGVAAKEPGHPDFRALREIIRDIIDDAVQRGDFDASFEPQATQDVIYALFQGLTEFGASSSTEAHRAALRTAKRLVSGELLGRANSRIAG